MVIEVTAEHTLKRKSSTLHLEAAAFLWVAGIISMVAAIDFLLCLLS